MATGTFINEDGGKVCFQQFAAGNKVNATTFDVTLDQLGAAFDTLFRSDETYLEVPLPARTLEIATLEDGVRVSMWQAKSRSRISQKVTWRDMVRFLTAK